MPREDRHCAFKKLRANTSVCIYVVSEGEFDGIVKCFWPWHFLETKILICGDANELTIASYNLSNVFLINERPLYRLLQRGHFNRKISKQPNILNLWTQIKSRIGQKHLTILIFTKKIIHTKKSLNTRLSLFSVDQSKAA